MIYSLYAKYCSCLFLPHKAQKFIPNRMHKSILAAFAACFFRKVWRHLVSLSLFLLLHFTLCDLTFCGSISSAFRQMIYSLYAKYCSCLFLPHKAQKFIPNRMHKSILAAFAACFFRKVWRHLVSLSLFLLLHFTLCGFTFYISLNLHLPKGKENIVPP